MNMQILKSDSELGTTIANIGTLVLDNARRLGSAAAFAERKDGGPYHHYSWSQLGADVLKLAAALDLLDSDNPRIAFIAGNSYRRQVCELAVMASGRISVPIFAGYPSTRMAELLDFSEVGMLITDLPEKVLALRREHLPDQLLLLNNTKPKLLQAFLNNGGRAQSVAAILADSTTPRRAATEDRLRAIDDDTICLIMYTSGTSGFPKGVQLTHGNLMSQQKALELCWRPEPGLRMLCYLPWHRSFGGLFERFFAVASGACLALDDGCGKDIDRLLENFAEIRPHVFFSVPKIFQEITARVQADPDIEQAFFHSELKFVFTAAAPLPMSSSEVFRTRGVPVVEGWGLTETSPCCTLTPFCLKRTPGIVGFPIPGVELTLADDGEILVRGANVMRGYFRNPEASQRVLSADGWLHTGDVGEFGPEGVRIVSRKERMFKLSNGEKVFPSQLEARIHARCQFIKYAYVFGSGQHQPHMLVFPNGQAFEGCGRVDNCVNPNNPEQLARCLSRCVAEINDQEAAGFRAIRRALVVGRELTIESNELTPSFKLIPKQIEQRYADCIRAMENERYDQLPSDVYVLNLEESSE